MRGDGRVFCRTYSANGTPRWWIEYWRGGKMYRESAGLTEEEARKRLSQVMKTLHRDDFIAPKERKVTVGELLDDLLSYLRLKGAKSVRQYESYVKSLREAFGAMRAAALTTADVRKFVEQQRALDKADATINRSTGALAQAFNLATKSTPPKVRIMPHIPKLREDNARQGFVEPAAFEAIAAFLPQPVADIARFAYASGWRKGEILPLRWDAVDRHSRECRLRTSKNGRPRTLPLDGELWDIIERRWQARTYTTAEGLPAISEYVFHGGAGQPVVDFKRSWTTACLKAGTPLLFHDLRRSAVRNMIRAGVSQAVAMSISGHRTTAMFHRYDITSVEDQRKALQRTEALREAAAAEGPKVMPLAAGAKPPKAAE